jgi:hypothetical protein
MTIRNTELYHDRTVQDWHRLLDRRYLAIDIDLLGACEWCRKTVYIIEATTNSDNKPTTIIRRLAMDVGSVALLVFHDAGVITGGRVLVPKNAPLRNAEHVIEALTWARYEYHKCREDAT